MMKLATGTLEHQTWPLLIYSLTWACAIFLSTLAHCIKPHTSNHHESLRLYTPEFTALGSSPFLENRRREALHAAKGSFRSIIAVVNRSNHVTCLAGSCCKAACASCRCCWKHVGDVDGVLGDRARVGSEIWRGLTPLIPKTYLLFAGLYLPFATSLSTHRVLCHRLLNIGFCLRIR